MNHKKPSSTEELYQKLMSATNAANLQHFSHQSEDIDVQIRPDKNVGLGNFKPDLQYPGHYKAHPQTIRAMKKNIFVGGEDGFIDLEEIITCESCNSQLDTQFWHFCPYCGASY